MKNKVNSIPILSVIVPVYNVSDYLREGLDSILNQDVQEIEVICVDDCSTDNSLAILEKYRAKDKRILIEKHCQNRGVSAARNTGIGVAGGKYIAFFDPDDLVLNTMYSRMIDVMEEKSVDLAMCGFVTFPNGHETIPNFTSNVVMKPTAFLSTNKRIHTNNDLCFSFRFVYKRSFLINKRLLFDERLKVGEDTLFNFACVLKANSVIMLPQALYLYRINNISSVMKQAYKPYLESCLQLQISEKKKLINEYRLDNYTPITKDMSEDVVRRYTTMLFNNLKNNTNEQDKLLGIKRILSMPMISEAMKIVGFRNIYPSWKEYVFYLAMKFNCVRLVRKLYFDE